MGDARLDVAFMPGSCPHLLDMCPCRTPAFLRWTPSSPLAPPLLRALSLSVRAKHGRAITGRAELVPPLPFPMRQATTALAACANIFANPFSLPCTRLGRLARSRSAAALSWVTMAAMAKLRAATNS
jgi:hypothetical protein